MAKKEAARINEVAAQATKDAALANERAAGLEKDAELAKKEAAQLRIELAKIDPSKRPIISASGYARVEVNLLTKSGQKPALNVIGAQNLKFRDMSRPDKFASVILRLGRKDAVSQNKWPLELNGNIISTTVSDPKDGEQHTRFDISFDAQDLSDLNKGKFSTADLTAVSIMLDSRLPQITDIYSGSVEITVNSSLKREFEIPPQKMTTDNICSVNVGGKFLSLSDAKKAVEAH